MKKFIAPLVILSIATGIMSCSSNTNSVTPSSVTFYSSVNNLGEEIITEEDTLRIDSVRMILEGLSLGYSGPPQMVMPGQTAVSFTQSNADQRLQITSDQIPAQTYYSSEFSISLPDQISVEHPEYSIYATGLYNGEQFQFGTDTTFSRGLNFSGGLNVPAQDAVIEITIGADLADWFRGEGDVLLNPASAADKNHIEQNIRPSFNLDVQSNIQ